MNDKDKEIQKKLLPLTDEEYDTAAGWLRLETKLPRPARKPIPFRTIGVAAGFILLAVSAYFLLFRKPEPAPPAYAYQPYIPAAPHTPKALPKDKSGPVVITGHSSPVKENQKTAISPAKRYRQLPPEKKLMAGNSALVTIPPVPQEAIAPVQPVPIDTPKKTTAVSSTSIATISAEEADRMMAETVSKNPKQKGAGLHLSLKGPESSNGIEKSSSPATLINF